VTGGAVLHLFHSQQPADQGESNATVWYMRSVVAQDAGHTLNWTEPLEVFSTPSSYVRNRVYQYPNGSMLLPMYYSRHGEDQFDYSHIKALRAGDDPADVQRWYDIDYTHTYRLVQPSIVPSARTSGPLTTFFRDKRSRFVYVSRTVDGGSSWVRAHPTSLPNNDAAIEAYRLRSGRLALAFNPQRSGRDPLAIALSEDDGVTWPYMRILEEEDGTQEFSYPSVREDRSQDGVIHVSYTYKRETIKYSRISEAWVMQGDNMRS